MMTREQAEAAARMGAKVRRKCWVATKWVTFDGDRFVNDYGVGIHPSALFDGDGWSIVEPAPAPTPGTVMPLSECGVGWLVRCTYPDGVTQIFLIHGSEFSDYPVTLLSAAPGWTPVGEGDPGRIVEGCWADGVLVRSGSPSWIHSFIRLGESLPPDGERLVFWRNVERDASHDAQAPVEPDLAAWDDDFHPATGKDAVVWCGAGRNPYISLKAIQALVPQLRVVEEPTFRTSRKPAPGDDEIALALVRHRADYFAQTGEEIPTIDSALFVIRLTRQSVLAQLAANEERAVKAYWGPENLTRDDAIRAALAAIREGL